MLNYFKSGTWNCICDVCGFEFKSDELTKRWDGLLVCKQDFEFDHPQKHIRVRETGIGVTPARPDPEPAFNYVCYLFGANAFADLGEADCARADIVIPSYLVLLSIKNAGAIT